MKDAAAGLRLRERVLMRAFLILPVAVLALAWLAGWDLRPGRLGLVLLAAGYAFSLGGVELGFHRLFSHRAYEAVPALRAALVVAGSTAGVGPVFGWAAMHRRHHLRSDAAGDPHSPNLPGRGALGRFWHAHVGWVWDLEVGMGEYKLVEDLIADPVVYRLGRARAYLLWAALGLALPAAAGAAIDGAAGARTGLLWGGALRMILTQQCAFAVASLGHLLGRRRFATGDGSRDSLLVALVTMGAGWQNTHHAFPGAASVQLRWWQADPGGWALALLARAGLASRLGAPTGREIEERSIR